MIIGVDARELEGKPTGVGSYLRNILTRVQLPPGSSLQLYFKKQIPDQLSDLEAEKILLKSSVNNMHWQQWHLWRALKKNRVKLLFSPANALPLHFHGVQVVTVHDLSFFRYPEWFSTKERVSRQLGTSLSLRQADRIYTVSSFIREELIARFHVPPSRVLVTPNGVSRKNCDFSLRSILRKSYELENATLVLYVGSIFNRRHIPVLMEAVSRLDAETVLVVIGENRTFPLQDLGALSRELKIENRVRLLDYVSDKVVQDYYQMADVFVYLSDYEGFGIPPLEAMSYGVPVILSATPAMDQVFQGAGRFVKAIDSEEVSLAIQQCLADPVQRERMVEEGRRLVDRYSWEETARIISDDWAQLLAQPAAEHK
ncbi:MAG: hypothetical protein C5B54_04090 [Acidobacteria bacterium]|nr:MAG: hypothetical protein C5B54_04090 [Acidobacteriota bacterium]